MYTHALSPPIFQSSCTVFLLLYLAQRSVLAVPLRLQLNKKGQPKKVWTMKVWYAFISFGSVYQVSFYFPPMKSLSKLSAHGYICIHTSWSLKPIRLFSSSEWMLKNLFPGEKKLSLLTALFSALLYTRLLWRHQLYFSEHLPADFGPHSASQHSRPQNYLYTVLKALTNKTSMKGWIISPISNVTVQQSSSSI